MELLTALVGVLGGAAAGVAVAKFLGKSLVEDLFARRLADYKNELSKGLADYKNELSNKSDEFKTELSIYAYHQNLGLARIDAQRAKSIMALWSRFIKWNDAYENLVNETRRLEKDADSVAKSREDLDSYNRKVEDLYAHVKRLGHGVKVRAIYFDSDEYEHIVSCYSKIDHLCTQFHTHLYGEYASKKTMPSKEFVSGLLKACDQLEGEVTASKNDLRRSLLKEFRNAYLSLEARRPKSTAAQRSNS
jgi:hypothetical protein